ncbi:type II toxin-antitoxin system RelE/ParE family toxin [Patescibacteria group bacterium]|nr:type II toxin-antitoxin system RelE/ParE family toxin [Candidatus Falkowbacteria bacterium]MBU3906122.1 type II toxin-antitoxin system RelE/ParE family toxin [Patescibacteria group bacterium]MCG2698511.1 type II toxin-antitoxin system RelE/ParE family toxin [Candidatus Parcubacteria bacterium]MBU4015524.1 type II toxin-antitoxin system RelE/ParE family toxin [Patescibacteria group bacterium]MBU4026070.1 type II toxin-antitoxin system RelE/ParE family toxin [Patescibacteria group bacterium]
MDYLKQSIQYDVIFSVEFNNILKPFKKKKLVIFQRLEKQIFKIAKNPFIGKPLRNTLRNYRRVHVSSFVLIYEIFQDEIRLIDFDHHDKIYRKYK